MGRPQLHPTKFPNLKRTTTRNRPGITEFYGDFTVGGKRHRPPLGKDLDTARKLLRDEMGRAKRKASGKRLAPQTLAEAQARFVELNSARVEESSRKRWGVDDRAAGQGLGADTLLSNISRVAVEEWLSKRVAKTSPASANRSLTRLRQVLSWCVQSGWLERDPTEGIRPYREPEERIRYLTAEEEAALREVCTLEEFAWIEFAFLTGLRVSEQLALTGDQVHDGFIWLEGTGTKTHRRRRVPVLGRVAAILEGRPGSGLLWGSPRGKQWQVNNFRNRFWKPLFDQAGLVDFVWHDLRHTFCSRLVQGGADLYRVCKLAGHRSISVTEKYAHLSPGNLQETMAILER